MEIPSDSQLYKDITKLNMLYEELCWHPNDELLFTHDGEEVIIVNKTLEKRKQL